MNVKAAKTQELLEIVGSERGGHPADLVAAAEAELARRAAGEEEVFRRKVRISGTVAAALGGFFVVWGLSMALLGLTILRTSEAVAADESFIFRHFDVIYVGGAFCQATAGAVLLWGGLSLRKLRRRGHLLVLAVLWMGFGFIALFTVAWVVSLPWQPGFDPFLVVMAGAGLANGAFWSFVLWLPYRFLASQRVRDACGG